MRIRKDGVENTALVYVDETGAPRLDIVHTAHTDLCNGVKVTVPVSPQNFYEFRHEYEFYSSFYPVTPTCNVEDATQAFDPSAFVGDTNDFVVDRPTKYVYASLGTQRVYALMGPVVYPIDLSAVTGIDDWDLQVMRGVHRYDRTAVLFIRFGIGEVSVAASRESLSLDAKTNRAISSKIAEYVKTLTEVATDIVRSDAHLVDKIAGVRKSINMREIADMALNSLPEFKRFVAKTPNIKKLLQLQASRTWSKRNRTFVKKPLTYAHKFYSMAFDANGILKDKFTVLCIDCDKKWVYDLVAEHIDRTGSAWCWDGWMSDKAASRIESIINIPVERVSYLKLYEDMLAEKRKNRKVAARTSYDDANIQASGVTVHTDPVHGISISGFPNTRIDIDENTFFLEEKPQDSEHLLNNVMHAIKLLGELGTSRNMVIVKKNKRNEKKIIRHNVPDIIDWLAEQSKQHVEEIKRINLFKGFDMPTGVYAILLMADSAHVPDVVKSAYSELKQYKESEIEHHMHRGNAVIDLLLDESDNAERAALMSKIGEVSAIVAGFDYESLRPVYPMLFAAEGYFRWTSHGCLTGAEFEHAVKYLKMVDEDGCIGN